MTGPGTSRRQLARELLNPAGAAFLAHLFRGEGKTSERSLSAELLHVLERLLDARAARGEEKRHVLEAAALPGQIRPPGARHGAPPPGLPHDDEVVVGGILLGVLDAREPLAVGLVARL